MAALTGTDISSIYEPDRTSFGPCIGFSYRPRSSQATVIRGGAGIFFDMPNANRFLDNRPGNSAPNGLEGNPGGSKPVFTLTTSASEGSPVQIVPGQEIIPTATLSIMVNPCGVFSVD